MELEKQRLNSLADWEEWKKRIVEDKYNNIDSNTAPTSYPCVVLWATWDQRGTHWDGGCHGFVYPSDF